MLQFTFEVMSKTEALKLDGSLMYVLQGKLKPVTDTESEPAMFAFPVTEDQFKEIEPGATLLFVENIS